MMPNKRVLGWSFFAIGVLLLGYIFSRSMLILLSIGFVCCMLVVMKPKNAACVLFLFAPLSYIIAYKQYNLYIFFVVAYMANLFLRNKINLMSGLLAFVVLAYCLIFANSAVGLKVGNVMCIIFLLLILFVCQSTDKKDYKKLVSCFIIGFVISAVVGVFKARMPLMANQFGLDYLYVNGIDYFINVERYSGLSYDPNYFALTDCIVISALLFTSKRWSIGKGLLLIFLITIGFLTFSKSYVLMLGIICAFYIIKYNRYAVRLLLCLFAILICLAIIETYTNIEVLGLIEARFTSAGDANGLTTGRIELWNEYIDYILKNPKCLLVGEGFNAFSLDKAAHNSYIEFLYHFGIVGCGLWLIYFWACFRAVVRFSGKRLKRRSRIPMFICLISVFFLSSFHFQQLWCCLCLALLASYMPQEEVNYAEIKRHYSDLQ